MFISKWPRFDFIYSILWSVLALFIPLSILTVCNVCLIRALRQSRRLQSQCRASCRSQSGTMTTGGQRATGSGNSGQQRITPTLVALIIIFTVCVGPSGLLEESRRRSCCKRLDLRDVSGSWTVWTNYLPYSWMDRGLRTGFKMANIDQMTFWTAEKACMLFERCFKLSLDFYLGLVDGQ